MSIFGKLFESRPSLDEWAPCSNFDDRDDEAAYTKAAADLGVEIKFGHPVPGTPVGADYAARCGYRGLYIRRSQKDMKDKLQRAKELELRKMST